MNDFDEEVFEYLTGDKKRFRYAHEIHQLFPQIREKIIDDFWESVELKLEEVTKDREWTVISHDDYKEQYSKLGIYFSSDDIRVIYEALHGQPYLGLWIDRKSEELDLDSIYSFAEDNLHMPEAMKETSNRYWLAQRDVQDDFSSLHTLESMLPGKKDQMAKEYANELYKLAENWKDDIEVILRKRLA